MTIHAEKNTDEMSAEEVRLLYDEAVFLFCSDKYEESIECFDRIISINPASMVAFCYKGLALQKLKRHQEAVHCYEKALLK
ncbi:MAG: tetratricopeptide repeat protein [Patescibacteria group bacterium]|nr:tetratricopeptide repeat protein [Patescibacteria group bacterium]